MRGLQVALSLPLLAVGVSAAVGGPGSRITQQTRTNAPTIIPGGYIVEFEDDHDPEDFYKTIAANASKKMDLNFKLFRGASIQFHNEQSSADSTEQLTALPAVKRMWPIRSYHIPEHTVHWAGNLDKASAAQQRRAADDTFSTHVMTQVSQLREKGVTGNGIRVAVVDTGVDYEHPALGGCYGPGCLVSFGYDLVGDAYNGSNKPQPSNKPPMDCNGHGTHVSGIIAAQGNNPFSVVGAAPGVELGMFRVFGCQGNVNDDVLIAAFNRAYEAGADLITSSVGGSSGWSEQAWSTVVSRIVENGVPCTISAGNDGMTGLFYASTAADGHHVVAVASVDNTQAPTLLSNATFTTGGDASTNTSFGYTAGAPANWTGVTLPLWAPDFNTSDAADGCKPFGTNSTDLSGNIVLLRRGTCFFTIKAENAHRRGAKYVIIYNNEPGTVQVDVATVPGIEGMAVVTAEQGAKWIASLARGEKVMVAMTDPATAPKTLVQATNNLTGGYMSVYSSWGPTFEVNVKPQMAAPGGQILSTFPRSMGSYAVLSGTSMACPMVAGIFALIMEARGTRDPKLIENVLAATAKPNLYHNGMHPQPYLAPVAQQGAGLLQAYDAAYATTLLSVSSLSFNDSDHHASVKNFTITNKGRHSVIYTLSHVGAGTAYTFLTETAITPARFPAELQVVARYGSLNFTSTNSSETGTASGGDGFTVVVPAGERRVISVRATPPEGLDAARMPVYSGYIAINGSDSSSLSVPYLGVAGSLRSLTVLDSVGSYLSNAREPNATRIAANTLFLLPTPQDKSSRNGSSNSTDDSKDAPPTYNNHTTLVQLNLNFAMGCPAIRADLVPIKLCNATPAGSVGGGNSIIANNHPIQDILGYHTLGPIKAFPMQWMSRDTFNATWDGALADGTFAPPGVYKLVFHALHIFGDPKQPSDYDVVESDQFRIRYYQGPGAAGNMTRKRQSNWENCP